MKKVLIIGKYFGYSVGGAERSMLTYLENEKNEIHYLFFNNLKYYSAMDKKFSLSSEWKKYIINLPIDWLYFPFIESLINGLILRNKINDIIQKNNITTVYTYGFYSVFLGLLKFNQEVKIFIRDEVGLGIFKNYKTGIRYIIYYPYKIINQLCILIWMGILSRANNCSVVYNSNFMKKLGESRFFFKKLQSEVIIPNINFDKLRLNYINNVNKKNKKYIVFFGDSDQKGINIFLSLTKTFPNENFLHAGSGNKKFMRKNIMVIDNKLPGWIYSRCKLLILPSQWMEAYGRVVAEAAALNIPTIASKIGGIEESASSNTILIENYKDFYEWKKEVQTFLKMNN